MRSSWTKPCWTSRSPSTPSANCSPWGSRSPSKVRTNTHTHTHTHTQRYKDTRVVIITLWCCHSPLWPYGDVCPQIKVKSQSHLYYTFLHLWKHTEDRKWVFLLSNIITIHLVYILLFKILKDTLHVIFIHRTNSSVSCSRTHTKVLKRESRKNNIVIKSQSNGW